MLHGESGLHAMCYVEREQKQDQECVWNLNIWIVEHTLDVRVQAVKQRHAMQAHVQVSFFMICHSWRGT